ncbi:MAG: 4-alpha-glucanotransferase [Candidatus Sericytochromatia bacterium]|nr:4-alpha-glucanotransferase [Candidatus Tanganyikabacteria bacterium]
MKLPRTGGLLLHPTSLPGPYGIGDVGPLAHYFVDFLAAAGQRLWQVLPLGPTSYGDSPYQCLSAFAGNPLLVSPDRLIEDDLLPREALVGYPRFPADRVDYEQVIPAKERLLRKAFAHFEANAPGPQRDRFERFRRALVHQSWLPDYVLFAALKAHHGGKCWADWARELRDRKPAAIAEARSALAPEIRFQEFAQFCFHRQWADLRAHAAQNDIRLVGDAPIFVAYDSADVWAHRDLFKLDPEGRPLAVAGVPPDYFSETGQLWGNPLYDWKRHEETGYAWWTERVRVLLSSVDLVRLDHFRGFESYWAVPAAEETAINGTWEPGPGRALFAALEDALGSLPIIAEDLGVITPPVEELRDGCGFPGMKVLQFAFGTGAKNAFLPHNHVRDSVVYSGTHDNDTTVGWYGGLPQADRDQIAAYLGRPVEDPAWALIHLAMGSVANAAIVPMQDVLSASSTARMNLPGAASGNWAWRFQNECLTEQLAARLAGLAKTFGRA